jgi:aminoglycoside phosphotransferase (APT) family kinase protein
MDVSLVAISSEQLHVWLSARFADRVGLSINALSAPNDGYSNVTLTGCMRWRDGVSDCAEEFLLRMQPSGESIFPGHDVMRQADILRALERTQLPVPRVLAIETKREVLGAPCFLMQRLPGKVPNENPLYHLEGWFYQSSTDDQRQMWFDGLDLLARMARVDWRTESLEFLKPSGDSPLESRLRYYRDAVHWSERQAQKDYPLLRRAGDWLMSHQPTGEPLAFSWGEAKLGNCLFDSGRLVGALDFEQASIGSPIDNLAWWLMLDDALSRGYGVPRLAALPPRDESIAYWESRSGHSAEHLEYYKIYAAWRFAFIMTRIAHAFRQRGWITLDSDMDTQNGAMTLLREHAALHGFAEI